MGGGDCVGQQSLSANTQKEKTVFDSFYIHLDQRKALPHGSETLGVLHITVRI